MNKLTYDFVQPKDVKGKIFLTCFPGREGTSITYKESIFITAIKNMVSLVQ